MSNEQADQDIDVIGEVVAVNVRTRRMHLNLESGDYIEIAFGETQEVGVISGLLQHRHTRLRVRGTGAYDQDRSLLNVKCGATFTIVSHDDFIYDKNARPIEEILEELGREIPQTEWDRLPQDLTARLDFYLYGQGES